MTKTKTKFYSLFAALLFVSVFFVVIDGIKNTAKADCYGTYNVCYDNAETDQDVDVCAVAYDKCFEADNVESICGDNEYNYEGECHCEDGYSEDDDGVCVVIACPLNSSVVDYSGDCVCNTGYYPDSIEGVCISDSVDTTCPTNTHLQSGVCVCDTGYTPDSDGICRLAVNFDKDGKVSTTCDEDPSCMYFNCCAKKYTETPAPTPTKTPEELEADKKAKNEATSNATARTSMQNAAAQKVDFEQKQQQSVCATDTKEACDVATASLNAAKDEYDKATIAAQEAVANLNRFSSDPTSGAGYLLCANGVLATICESGGGTPYVAGISAGNYGGGGSGGFGSYGGRSGGINSPKCETGFQDIGGVCFPGNTGLSNAPIYVIVSNIFSWLMGLFTTLAVVAFVVSGIQYFMASGDESMAESAKDNAKNASIGILVGLSGFIIIKAIAAALSGTSYFF